MTRDEIIKLILDKADASGIKQYEFLGGAIAESGLNPTSERDGDFPDISVGLFQQTVAFAAEGDHTASPANMALLRQLYFDPVHATDVALKQYLYWRTDPDTLPLTAWAAYNGGAGFYRQWYDSPNLENYRSGLRQAAAILGVTPDVDGTIIDIDVPDSVTIQHDDWSCAVHTTYAALWTLNKLGQFPPVTYADGGPNDVYAWMVPSLDDPSVGLHYGDGHEIVALLRSKGLVAEAFTNASLPRVQAQAGKKLLLLGFHNWGGSGHWSYCRGVDDEGVLILENPNGSYHGIADQLRDSFADIGPCTMVAIDIPGAAVPVPVIPPPITPPGEDMARIAELEAQVASITAERDQYLKERNSLIEGLAVVGDDFCDELVKTLDAFQTAYNEVDNDLFATIDKIRKVRTERVGPRPK